MRLTLVFYQAHQGVFTHAGERGGWHGFVAPNPPPPLGATNFCMQNFS
jgi:hypothetical protein